MPFQLKIHEDCTTGLVATCDLCGKTVTGATGHVVWKHPQGAKPGMFVEYEIVCKGVCDREVEREEHHSWQQLDVALVYLLNNAQVDMDEACGRAIRLSQLG